MKCPYTWVKNVVGSVLPGRSGDSELAKNLRVTVTREAVRTVDVYLPADSARWLIELIPENVLTKIRAEGIPIERIQDDLAARAQLTPQPIFSLSEAHRSVDVWLE